MTRVGKDLLQVPELVPQAARAWSKSCYALDVFPVPLGHFASKIQDLSYQEKDSRSPVCPLQVLCYLV